MEINYKAWDYRIGTGKIAEKWVDLQLSKVGIKHELITAFNGDKEKPQRVDLPGRQNAVLPDFWLPELDGYIEVKYRDHFTSFCKQKRIGWDRKYHKDYKYLDKEMWYRVFYLIIVGDRWYFDSVFDLSEKTIMPNVSYGEYSNYYFWDVDSLTPFDPTLRRLIYGFSK